MARLKPIPTPLPVRWREFRIRFLPPLGFLVVAVLLVMLWKDVGVRGFPGMGDAGVTVVSAPQMGVLEAVLVQPYEVVEAGQPLATLRPADARAVFDLIQAELALGRLQHEPTMAEENAVSFERVRLDLLRTRSELAIARVNLARAEREVERYTPLLKEKLLSQDLYEISVSTRDALRAEIEAKTSAVESVERRLAELGTLGLTGVSGAAGNREVLARLESLLVQATTNFAPVMLVAPRAGMVQAVARQAGESVQPGEFLFGLSPLRSERIVGYLRQPYPVDLAVGTPIRVMTRERHRRVFDTEVMQVGARLEVITNALAFVRPGALVDSGLPFAVRLPDGVALRPGEVVDLHLVPTNSFSVQGLLRLGRSSPPAD